LWRFSPTACKATPDNCNRQSPCFINTARLHRVGSATISAMRSEFIAKNLAKVRQRVRLAAEKSQRNPAEIRILAVSKTRPAEDIRFAYQQGMTDFGENYLQESQKKIESLADLPLCWHFIGPIQSNKTRVIASRFQWVHSVDRLKIARRLSEQRPADLPALNICLQVNISGEDSKSGVPPTELDALAAEVTGLPRLALRGLMTIPAPSADPEFQQTALIETHALFQKLHLDHPTMDTLSMGMSADLEAAVAAGSTCVRIGTDIFGPRAT